MTRRRRRRSRLSSAATGPPVAADAASHLCLPATQDRPCADNSDELPQVLHALLCVFASALCSGDGEIALKILLMPDVWRWMMHLRTSLWPFPFFLGLALALVRVVFPCLGCAPNVASLHHNHLRACGYAWALLAVKTLCQSHGFAIS